ncbi:MAG: hypothetical protein VKP62_09955 [Candidatus Sericytochromatia bacterium]|nr:hypothetical protein [Candidatus Sericytochromatia bacterium]
MKRKRRAKVEVLRDLDALLVRAESLRDAAAGDELSLARVAIARLAWRQEVLALLPEMSKGMQVAVDFQRAAQSVGATAVSDLAAEWGHHRAAIGAPLEVLRSAIDAWRRSGTRPLE